MITQTTWKKTSVTTPPPPSEIASFWTPPPPIPSEFLLPFEGGYG